MPQRDPDVVREEVEDLVTVIGERTDDGHDEQLFDLLVAAYPSRDSQLN